MKRKTLTSKRLVTLVILAMVGVAVPTQAGDFFPLDVWEVMGTWQPNPAAVYLTMAKAYRQPMSMEPNRVEKVSPSFPFDVWKELNDLDGIDANRINAFVIGYAARSGERNPNPYWLPEELNAP
jgi:hypothetical protein